MGSNKSENRGEGEVEGENDDKNDVDDKGKGNDDNDVVDAKVVVDSGIASATLVGSFENKSSFLISTSSPHLFRIFNERSNQSISLVASFSLFLKRSTLNFSVWGRFLVVGIEMKGTTVAVVGKTVGILSKMNTFCWTTFTKVIGIISFPGLT